MAELKFSQITQWILENEETNFMEKEILRHLKIYEEQVERAIQKLEITILYGTEEARWLHLEEQKHVEYVLIENREIIENLMQKLPKDCSFEHFTFRNVVYFAHEFYCTTVLGKIRNAMKNLAS